MRLSSRQSVRAVAALAIALGIAGLSSCGESTAPVVTTLAMTPGSATIREVGQTLQLTADAKRDGVAVDPATLAWSSSDARVATVSSTGLVTARGPGSAVITVAFEDRTRSVTVTVPQATRYFVSTATPVLGFGETVQLFGLTDYADAPGSWNTPSAWVSRNPAVVTVDSTGKARGTARAGRAWIIATSPRGMVDSTLLTVWDPSFYAWPDTNVVPLGTTRTLRVEQFVSPYTAFKTLSGITWRSTNPAVASVSSTGVVTPLQAGQTTIIGQLDTLSTSAEVFVPAAAARTYTGVAVGNSMACALADGQPYCWGAVPALARPSLVTDRCESLAPPLKAPGNNLRITRRCAGTPTLLPTTPRFATLIDGIAALTADGVLYTLADTGFANAGFGVKFSTVSVTTHWCGVALDGAGYCWGSNFSGALGIGTAQELGPYPSTPQLLTEGSAKWSTIATNSGSSCGLSTTGQAYCWGGNPGFRLGVGPDSTVRTGCTGPCVLVPTAVQSTVSFSMLAMQPGDACAATTGGVETYCWGNVPAALPHAQAGVPVKVAGAPQFRALFGGAQLCGVGFDDVAYCLSRRSAASDLGSLYSFVRLPLPFPVRSLALGNIPSCATATDGRIYCWGAGTLGALGDGQFTNATSSSPALVAGQ